MKQKLKVLVVDDEEVVQRFFNSFFKDKNVEVDMVGNGKDAVSSAKKNHYDLILMDIVLPEIHGVQAYEKIKEAGKEIPTIMFTGYAVDSLINRAIKDGITAIMRKPFTVKELEDKIKSVIKQNNLHLLRKVYPAWRKAT